MYTGKLLKMLGESIAVGEYMKGGYGSHVTAKMSITVLEASRILTQANKSVLITTDDEDVPTITGMFTDGDIRKAMASGVVARETKLVKIMTRQEKFVSVNDTDSLSEAAKKMVENNIRHVVVYQKGVLLGVLQAEDLLPMFV